MVKPKKKSRTVSRAIKSETDVDEKVNDDYDKEQLLKRLADFDMQVEQTKAKMENEKETIIRIIENLYFVDEQKTSADTNKMLWNDFLALNTCNAKSTIRRSIVELIGKTEQRPKRKKAGGSTIKKTTTKKQICESTPATRSSKRGKILMEVDCTPQNQNIPVMSSSMLITPKFDPRVPIPPSTLRKPRMGEVAVSLNGSPLLLASKSSKVDYIQSEIVDEETKVEIKELQDKLSKLLENKILI